jgi:hypothetical protein
MEMARKAGIEPSASAREKAQAAIAASIEKLRIEKE